MTPGLDADAAGPAEAGRPDRAAQQLWDAFHRARTDRAGPAAVADLEDEVFRFYLPLARSIFVVHPTALVDAVAAERAAEIALAQAVLGWRRRDSTGFPRFARDRINTLLGQLHARQLQARAADKPSGES
ncbi:hypothetical protein ACVBEQ_04760 [Nakamurella sp. GG22]